MGKYVMKQPRKARRPSRVVPHLGYAGVLCVSLSRDARFALIDETDRDLVTPYCWRAMRYAAGPYVNAASNKKTILLHRVVMGLASDDPRMVDHRDFNVLDNRKANLRIATSAQNLQNVRPKGSSQFKGIHQIHNGKWRAEIGHGKNKQHLGYYLTAEAAALAYDAKAAELYGEFAWLNFPQAIAKPSGFGANAISSI